LTFLFTDIEGSTALLRRLGDDAYSRALEDHHRIVRAAIVSLGGQEKGTQGDSFFATFTSPKACVAAAVEIQRSIAIHDWPEGERLRVRIGIHTGEVAEMSTGLVGYEVHRAARIAAVGHGGQVLLSSAVAGLLEDTLPPDESLRDLGAHRLKDLGRPETIFQLVAEGLEREFEPLRSLDNPDLTNNLPASLNPFIGRLAELEEVRALVVQSRLVTLTGAGGSGKTRLALQVAAELLDGSGEGVWFVELAPVTDPDQVSSTVISAMQLHQESEISPLESLIKMLKAQNVLLVLDNSEHVIDMVAKMVDLIGRNCPRVSIIVTSREPLGVDGEQVYRVRSLSLPPEMVEDVEDLDGSDAVELFVAQVRSRDSTFELNDTVAPLVASVCRRLDGIPLAIELAASRLASMSLDDLHDRLDQRFRLLTGGSRNALPRQQTLGATVAWSYDLLTEPERDLLRRLSVFVGGFDLEGAEAICTGRGFESFDVADLLSSLVNKSLVTSERISTSLRYRLLETIRQYAAEQLVQNGVESNAEEIRRLHADHYLQLCLRAAPELTGPHQGTWLKRLDLEYDNVLATFDTLSADPERTADVLALGAALPRFVQTRRNPVLARFVSDALSSNTVVPVALRAEALLALSNMKLLNFSEDGSKQIAYELSEQALALAGQLDDDFRVRAMIGLADACTYRGQPDLAVEYASAALDLALRIKIPRRIAEALGILAYADLTAPEARGHILESLAIFRQINDTLMISTMLAQLSLSRIETDQGLHEGRVLNQEAMELAEEIGSSFHLLFLGYLAGAYSLFLGELDLAVQQSRQVLRDSRRNGSAATLDYWTIFTLACCAVRQEHFTLGALLCGAHEAFEERAIEPIAGVWTPRELEARENNRLVLREALGVDEYERLVALGKSLSVDRVYDLAMGRSSHAE
jgi:predicted ATPase/class 3 adenylate cyclase